MPAAAAAAAAACGCPAKGSARGGAGVAHELAAATAALLSSSCCLLQLLLNSVGIGCAGFSVLTPYRSVFRLVTAGVLGWVLARQGLTRRSLATLLLSAALMASEEVVAAHNRGSMLQQQQHKQQASHLPASSSMHLLVRGLRCEACAARLRAKLSAVEGVDAAAVFFSEGRVEVRSRGPPVPLSVLQAAVAATDPTYSMSLLAAPDCFDAAGVQQTCPPDSTAAAAAAAEEPGSSSSSSDTREQGDPEL